MMTQSLEAVTAKIVIYQKLQMLFSFNGLWILFFLDIFGFFSPLGYPSPMYGRSAFNDVLPSHASFLQPSTKLVVYCFGSSTRIITSKRALVDYPLSLPPQLPALPSTSDAHVECFHPTPWSLNYPLTQFDLLIIFIQDSLALHIMHRGILTRSDLKREVKLTLPR